MAKRVITSLGRKWTIWLDEADLDLLTRRWKISISNGGAYLVRNYWVMIDGRRRCRTMRLHRVILERKLERELEPGELPDHKNLNPLDNRRTNLRVATRSQNAMNRRLSRRSTTGLRGVTREGVYWRARVQVKGKMRCLGRFRSKQAAVEARRRGELELHGEFASGTVKARQAVRASAHVEDRWRKG